MMRIERARESASFHRDVTERGRKYLQSHPATPGSKLPAYWNDYRDEFFRAYHGICAYTLTAIIREHGFQMDHFNPKGNPAYRMQAYDWDNFRLASPRLNLRKRTSLIADPFTLPKDACRIGFLRGRISLDDRLPQSKRDLISGTIKLLQLNADAAPETRTKAYVRYRRKEINVTSLARRYPFVAYEMLRQGKIRNEDCDECRSILHSLGFLWVNI